MYSVFDIESYGYKHEYWSVQTTRGRKYIGSEPEKNKIEIVFVRLMLNNGRTASGRAQGYDFKDTYEIALKRAFIDLYDEIPLTTLIARKVHTFLHLQKMLRETVGLNICTCNKDEGLPSNTRLYCPCFPATKFELEDQWGPDYEDSLLDFEGSPIKWDPYCLCVNEKPYNTDGIYATETPEDKVPSLPFIAMWSTN